MGLMTTVLKNVATGIVTIRSSISAALFSDSIVVRAKCTTAAGGVSDLRTSEATTMARVYR